MLNIRTDMKIIIEKLLKVETDRLLTFDPPRIIDCNRYILTATLLLVKKYVLKNTEI